MLGLYYCFNSSFSFCFALYTFFFFSPRHSGWLYAQAWKSKRCFFFFFWVYCNNSSFFCLWLLDILRTPALNLYCVIVPLSFLFISLLLFFFFFFLNHSFSVVSARSWYCSSACNHNSLIMFIDFNIKIIKPLAPHLVSCMFDWST